MSEQDALIDEATRWIVRLNSGQASAVEQQAFQEWRARDPRAEQLCARLEKTLGVLRVPIAQGVGTDLLRRTLDVPSSRRKLLGQALVFGGVALGAGMLGSRVLPIENLVADLRTGTGERLRIVLEDGSKLTLNARSTVDVTFNTHWRRLHLLTGEILVQVAGETTRPFIVETRFGEVATQGRDLLLRHGDAGSRVFSLTSPLALKSSSGAQLKLMPGQQVGFDRLGFGPVTLNQGTESAWIDGLLEFRDRPLSEVIEALRPYRRGLVRVDPAIAELRVSGLFRLDDSDLMLEALVRTLPIRISRFTDFWIALEAV